MSLPANRSPEEWSPQHDRRTNRRARESMDTALVHCRNALRNEMKWHDLDESWRRPVKAFASFTSRQNVPPERVLATFKKMVSELALVQRLPVDERNAVVRRLVEVAIEAYYRESRDRRR